METTTFSTPASVAIALQSFDKDVLFSGIVHCAATGRIKMAFGGLNFIFEFLNDKEKQRMDSESKDNKTLLLKIYNFNNSVGTGLLEPIKIGTYNKRAMYLIFVVHCLNESGPKTFTYTFLSGEVASE